MEGFIKTRSKVQHFAYYVCVSCVVVAHLLRRGIRGTQVDASIQDILDEVAPIEAPYRVEGRFIQM